MEPKFFRFFQYLESILSNFIVRKELNTYLSATLRTADFCLNFIRRPSTKGDQGAADFGPKVLEADKGRPHLWLLRPKRFFLPKVLEADKVGSLRLAGLHRPKRGGGAQSG